MNTEVPAPTVQMDGNQFHAHSGESFPHGVSGFGDTEADAISEYESNYLAANLSEVPLEGAPSALEVKGLVEQIRGPSIEEVSPQITAEETPDEDLTQITERQVLSLTELCQIMWSPENQPPQFSVEEAWEKFQAIK